MRPQSGGRVAFELVGAGTEVDYRVALYLPDDEWHGTARIDAAGIVTLDGVGAAPVWLADYARAFLRTEWRARRGPDPEPWPDRIGRWRAEGS